MRAILAPSILSGIPSLGFSLKMMQPLTTLESLTLPPATFLALTRSLSMLALPSVLSAMLVTAETPKRAMCSFVSPERRPPMVVFAILSRASLSSMETVETFWPRTSMALVFALWYPFIMIVGWTFLFSRAPAFLRSSPVSTTAVFVPSPLTSSWFLATSTKSLVTGFSMSMCSSVTRPSLVTI